jgi:hypothetical protein
VSQIGAASAPAGIGLSDFLVVNRLAPVLHLGEEEGAMHLPFLGGFDAGQCHPSGLASWINLERDGLKSAVFHASIFEANDERLHPMDHRPPTREQEPRPFGRTGHQGPFLLI